MHQLLVVDPKWVEDASDEVKSGLLKAMVNAENLAKKCKVHAAFCALKNCHPNPWSPPILKDILSGHLKQNSTGSLLYIQTLVVYIPLKFIIYVFFDLQITSMVNAMTFA